MPRGYTNEVLTLIDKADEGSIFVISDFFDIACSSTIRTILNRLVQEGYLRQVLKGVFEKPKFDELTGKCADVNPDAVARTLARIFHWSIAPYGSAAVNLLGLPAQQSALQNAMGTPDCLYIYASSGPYRVYDLGSAKLEFKHRANRDILGFSYKTGLVTQALKRIGKGNITQEIINILSERLSEDEKKIMLQETRRSTGWVRDAVWEIAGRRW